MKSDVEPDLYDWVKLVAADQTAGTWTHVEGETPEVVEKYGAKVIGIYPMAGERAVVARIAFPTRNFPAYLPMIMSTVAGNVLGQDGIRLVDIDFPDSVLKDVSAAGALKAAMGGADVIKDDELQSYPEYSPMEKRVRAVMDLLRANGKDKACLYAVNITGENLFDRARRAIDAGANSLMVNYQSMGWGAVEDFIRAMKRENLIYPIFGHCAGMGAYYRSATNGIATALSCGKLARIVGMDMPLVYPDSGRFGISTNELVETHAQCIAPMKNIKSCFMTVAGGVHAGAIEYLMNLLGNDCMLMAGGGIYGHPMGAEAGAKSILDAMEAYGKGQKVQDAALNSPELAAAVEKWGTHGG